ncbi:LOW QUALITY PROTEIN: hypothetical protein ACHAW6_013883 [Cyclotella cf. meneghiniana]
MTVDSMLVWMAQPIAPDCKSAFVSTLSTATGKISLGCCSWMDVIICVNFDGPTLLILDVPQIILPC